MRIRSSLEVHPGASNPQTFFWDAITIGDPPPRLWRNKTTYVNTWSVKHIDASTDPPGTPTAVATDQESRTKYGPRSGEWSTELLSSIVGQPTTDAQDLADAWLARTRIPLFHVDPLTLAFTPDIMSDLSQSQNWWDSWTALLSHGPSQVGRLVRGQVTPGGPQLAMFVESTTIRYTDDGWEVDLSLSPVAAYSGEMTTTIRGTIPSSTYSPGVWPTMLGLYVTRAEDAERIPYGTVTYDGNTYAVDQHGNIPPLPMQTLAVGANTITIQYTPAAGSDVTGCTRTETITRLEDTAPWHDEWADQW